MGLITPEIRGEFDIFRIFKKTKHLFLHGQTNSRVLGVKIRGEFDIFLEFLRKPNTYFCMAKSMAVC